MALKPEVSLPVALATGTLVYVIYSRGLPPTADLRVSRQGDDDADAIRTQNAWMAAAVVSAISLMAKDGTVFIVGGAMVVGIDWVTRSAIFTDPLTGRLDLNPFGEEMRRETPADTVPGEPAADNFVSVI